MIRKSIMKSLKIVQINVLDQRYELDWSFYCLSYIKIIVKKTYLACKKEMICCRLNYTSTIELDLWISIFDMRMCN